MEATGIAIVKPISVRSVNLASLRAVIDYIKDGDKTQNGELVFGWNCRKDHTSQDMCITKNLYGKITGRQYAHFVQSFDERDDLTPEKAFQIGQEYIAGLKQWEDYQTLMAVHTNEDHLHIHYVINSVNSKDGAKWQCSKQDLKHFRQQSDQLCRKYNLHVIEHGRRVHQSYGEYTANQKGGSWKQQLAADIASCLELSRSRADFLHRLNEFGVDVDFGDTNVMFYINAGTYGLEKEIKCSDYPLRSYGDFSAAAIQKALASNQSAIERAFDNPSLLMDAMYELGQMFNTPHESLLKRFYNRTFGKLEGRALREWILKHKDQAFEPNSYNVWAHSQEHGNGYEL